MAAVRVTVFNSVYLSGNLDDDSNCEVGMIQFPSGKTPGGQAAQWLYEITLREEFAKINELTGMITLSSRNTNKSWGKESCGQLGRDGGLRLWFDGTLSEGGTILQGFIKLYT
jgi:hypothetical protein